MEKLPPKLFNAALSYLLAQHGRGTQARLVAQTGIDRGQLNKIVKGKISGSEENRVKISAALETTYEDMLALGRRIMEGTPEVESEDRTGQKEPIAVAAEESGQEERRKTGRRVADILSPQLRSLLEAARYLEKNSPNAFHIVLGKILERAEIEKATKEKKRANSSY